LLLVLAALAACCGAGGCLPETEEKPDDEKPILDANEPSSRVQFVNASPYDASVVYYVGREHQRFEPALLEDPSRRRTAVVPARGRFESAAIRCPEIESVKVTEIRLDLGGSVPAIVASPIYLQGEDYECEDTLRIVFDYRIQTGTPALELVIPEDCNGNQSPDDDDLDAGTSLDCNANEIPDECDIAAGDAADADADGVPDECANQP
jgi:hypothetical protein